MRCHQRDTSLAGFCTRWTNKSSSPVASDIRMKHAACTNHTNRIPHGGCLCYYIMMTHNRRHRALENDIGGGVSSLSVQQEMLFIQSFLQLWHIKRTRMVCVRQSPGPDDDDEVVYTGGTPSTSTRQNHRCLSGTIEEGWTRATGWKSVSGNTSR